MDSGILEISKPETPWQGLQPPTPHACVSGFCKGQQVAPNKLASGCLSSFPGLAVTQVIMFSLGTQTCSHWPLSGPPPDIPGLELGTLFPVKIAARVHMGQSA